MNSCAPLAMMNRVKRLKWPYNMCVAGQYVYVADIGVDKIVVFTTEVGLCDLIW